MENKNKNIFKIVCICLLVIITLIEVFVLCVPYINKKDNKDVVNKVDHKETITDEDIQIEDEIIDDDKSEDNEINCQFGEEDTDDRCYYNVSIDDIKKFNSNDCSKYFSIYTENNIEFNINSIDICGYKKYDFPSKINYEVAFDYLPSIVNKIDINKKYYLNEEFNEDNNLAQKDDFYIIYKDGSLYLANELGELLLIDNVDSIQYIDFYDCNSFLYIWAKKEDGIYQISFDDFNLDDFNLNLKSNKDYIIKKLTNDSSYDGIAIKSYSGTCGISFVSYFYNSNNEFYNTNSLVKYPSIKQAYSYDENFYIDIDGYLYLNGKKQDYKINLLLINDNTNIVEGYITNDKDHYIDSNGKFVKQKNKIKNIYINDYYEYLLQYDDNNNYYYQSNYYTEIF